MRVCLQRKLDTVRANMEALTRAPRLRQLLLGLPDATERRTWRALVCVHELYVRFNLVHVAMGPQHIMCDSNHLTQHTYAKYLTSIEEQKGGGRAIVPVALPPDDDEPPSLRVLRRFWTWRTRVLINSFVARMDNSQITTGAALVFASVGPMPRTLATHMANHVQRNALHAYRHGALVAPELHRRAQTSNDTLDLVVDGPDYFDFDQELRRLRSEAAAGL